MVPSGRVGYYAFPEVMQKIRYKHWAVEHIEYTGIVIACPYSSFPWPGSQDPVCQPHFTVLILEPLLIPKALTLNS